MRVVRTRRRHMGQRGVVKRAVACGRSGRAGRQFLHEHSVCEGALACVMATAGRTGSVCVLECWHKREEARAVACSRLPPAVSV